MAAPLISVVIPAYNHELFVGLAIESVLNQSCSDLELIVVNDGSTDGTGAVVSGFQDSRIRYFYQDNQDAYNTINRGISLARGQYIAILNSDDIYTIDRLQTMVDHCQANNQVCAFTDVVPVDDKNQEFTDAVFGWNVWHQENRAFFFSCEDLYTAFLHGNFMVTTSNLFMTSEAAKAVGPFSSLRYLHDYDYIFRMVTKYPDQVSYMHDKKLLYYRIHGGNTLGEAAIIGREQDQELIRHYMLAAVPEAYHERIAAGSQRLVTLERELGEVRQRLHQPESIGVRAAFGNLRQAMKTWVGKQLGTAKKEPQP